MTAPCLAFVSLVLAGHCLECYLGPTSPSGCITLFLRSQMPDYVACPLSCERWMALSVWSTTAVLLVLNELSLLNMQQADGNTVSSELQASHQVVLRLQHPSRNQLYTPSGESERTSKCT